MNQSPSDFVDNLLKQGMNVAEICNKAILYATGNQFIIGAQQKKQFIDSVQQVVSQKIHSQSGGTHCSKRVMDRDDIFNLWMDN